MNPRLAIAGFNGAAAVGFAAFGAHALPDGMAAGLRAAFETGADMHLLHAVLLAVLAMDTPPGKDARRFIPAFALVLAGTLLFSGSLYALALTGARPLAFVTPVGGLALIGGWVALGLAAMRREN